MIDDTWGERNDKWRSRDRFRFGRSGPPVDVAFYIAPYSALEEAARRFGRRDPFAVEPSEYETVVRETVEEVWPDAPAVVEPWGGPKVGGPVPEEQYGVAVGVALDWIANGITVATLGYHAVKALNKLEALTRHRVAVTEGSAALIAAHAVADATGVIEVDIMSCEPLIEPPNPDDDIPAPILTGYAVSLEADGKAHVVIVDPYGAVSMPRTK